MVKVAPSPARILILVGFALSCVGLFLFLWISFGGSVPLAAQGYRVHVLVPEAGALSEQADVRISGVRVGRVVALRLGPREPRLGDTSDATLEIDRRFAPVAADAVAVLREKSLLGETYVELGPGGGARLVNGGGVADSVPDGGTLGRAQVRPSVQLDEIFRAFDARTRVAFETWLQAQAGALRGRSLVFNDALGNLTPFAEDATRLVRVLDTQQLAVRRLVRNAGVVFAALAERDGQLRALIRGANDVFRTTARRDADLRATFAALPRFEAESRVTLGRVTAFARDANPLVQQELRPAARRLAPVLRRLERLAPELGSTLHALGPLTRAARAGLPALRRLLDEAGPLLASTVPLLDQLNPILRFAGLYKHELTAFIVNAVAITEAVDQPPRSKVPVHYLRGMADLNPEALAAYPERIGSNRADAYRPAGAFRSLGRPNLPVYDPRGCGNPTPARPTRPPLIPNLPVPSPGAATTIQLIARLMYGGARGAIRTVPCTRQHDFPAPFRTAFPHVLPDPPTLSTRR